MFVLDKNAFKKLWSIFDRQDRSVSKWDDNRTDQDVFIRRTLSKWFEGKPFQVIFDKYVPEAGLVGIQIIPAHRIKYTQYVFVCRIYFAFAPYHDQITVQFAEPHSIAIQKVNIKRGDWWDMFVQEDKESWTVLRRFYPIEKIKIDLPQALK